MAEQPTEQPLPLEAGTPLTQGHQEHAWLVEGLDQQYTFDENASMWVAHVRCVHCGLRTAFRAADVPPCRPQEAQP